MLQLSMFTSEIGVPPIPTEPHVHEGQADAYATVDVGSARTGAFWLDIHVDDTTKGRALAAAILTACEITEAARARWTTDNPMVEADPVDDAVHQHVSALDVDEAGAAQAAAARADYPF